MTKNLIILALVTINMVFIWTFFQTSSPETPAKAQLSTESKPSVVEPGVHEVETPILKVLPSGDYLSMIDQLRAAGIEESLLKQMMLATINRDYLQLRNNEPDSPYWQPEKISAENKLSADLIWELDRREQLINLFGVEIVEDPLFVDLFKPLNKNLSFLSSDKQLALDELRRRDEARTQALFRNGFTQESRNDLIDQRSELQRQIDELLGPDDGLEYQLRESRLADRMRRGLGSFDYSETEFRDIFNIRQSNEGNEQNSRLTDRSEYRNQREQSEQAIRDYFGDTRYEEYARSQDPTYRSLQSIGERYGNTTSEINDVYEITQATLQRIAEFRQGNTLTREQRVERVQEIRSEAYEQIEQIVGKDTTDSIRDNSGRLGFNRGISQRILP